MKILSAELNFEKSKPIQFRVLQKPSGFVESVTLTIMTHRTSLTTHDLVFDISVVIGSTKTNDMISSRIYHHYNATLNSNEPFPSKILDGPLKDAIVKIVSMSIDNLYLEIDTQLPKTRYAGFKYAKMTLEEYNILISQTSILQRPEYN